MSIASSLYSRETSPMESFVWLGVDFGTATTECVLRIETRGEPDRVLILAASGQRRTDATVVIPSAIELDEELIRTGVNLSGHGQILDNLKLDLIHEIDRELAQAELFRPEGPFAYAVAHVASVIALARRAIQQVVGNRSTGYYVNLAAPIGPDPEDQRHRKRKAVFHALAYKALQLSECCGEIPIRRDDFLRGYGQVINNPVPEPSKSPVYVVPEALAAVTAYLNAPNWNTGNYASIDIGGGSTDVSFFWFHNGHFAPVPELRAWYYSVQTASVGMSDLFEDLKDVLVNHRGRTRHEQLCSLPALEPYRDREAVETLLAAVSKIYRAAFVESFTLRPNFADWVQDMTSRWDLFLLGGGCSDTLLRDHCANHPPDNLIDFHRTTTEGGCPLTLDIILPSGQILRQGDAATRRFDVDVLKVTGHMLTVAYGLSFRAPDIPKYGMEESVEPPDLPPPWEPPPHTVHA